MSVRVCGCFFFFCVRACVCVCVCVFGGTCLGRAPPLLEREKVSAIACLRRGVAEF